jgi:hypothetical protein
MYLIKYFIYYVRLIEKLVIGHLKRVEISSDIFVTR